MSDDRSFHSVKVMAVLLPAEITDGRVCILLIEDALIMMLWLSAGKAELTNETSNSF